MKLIIVIIRDELADMISGALVTAGLRVTRIASTGGMLRRGSTTLMVGLEDDKLEPALQVIRQTCPPSTDPHSRNATLFVLPVLHYTHF
jgi:uncharacterized protein YaaQ